MTAGTDVVDVYCPACRRYHAAGVTRDSEGWPVFSRWMTPHAQAERDGLGRHLGAVMSIGLDTGDAALVDAALDQALQVNDPDPEDAA